MLELIELAESLFNWPFRPSAISLGDSSSERFVGLKISDVLITLQNAAKTLLQWFRDHRMKANAYKYHLLIINNTKESFQIKIGNETASNNKYEKLLGLKVDHELNFNEHVSLLCKKASQKLNALSWIAFCMTFDWGRLILNSFIISHFSYCPIIWMFYSRKLNERTNRSHESVLRIVYKVFKLSFQEWLIEDSSLNVHQWMKSSKLKMAYHLSSWMLFIEKPYSLRTTSHFRSCTIRTTKYGVETLSYLGLKSRNLVQNEYTTT